MRSLLAMWTVSVLAVATVSADEATRTIHDVAAIENGSGQARILFRIGGLSDLGPILIKHAILRIP